MKKKTLFNIKGAGRTAVHDRGIRHIPRDIIKRPTALHLTVKIERSKAGLKNKSILKQLHHAIKKARTKGLKILHYTLEYDHVHLLVEADNNKILGQGMQSFGICFSKGINKIKHLAGRVFKTRYHYRQLKTPREIKNAFNYIVGNAIKHKEASSILSLYNSLVMVKSFGKIYPGFELMIDEMIRKSQALTDLRLELKKILSMPGTYLVKQLIN